MYLTSRAENANTTAELPIPYQVVAPTGKFDGNDGKWSTFSINVGDRDGSGRGQNFRVLVSTSSSVTQVPMQASWCSQDDCAQERGIEVYQSRQPKGLIAEASTGWTQNGIYSYTTPYWWSGRNINATWGWSNVGLGPSSIQSPILEQQMVVGNTNEEFFLGSFGVEVQPINTGGGPQATYLDNLAYNNQSASRSYGYTAGASYRNSNGAPGNLVLGGYDKSRMGDGLEVKMVGNGNHTLIVGIQSIEYLPDRDVDTETYSMTAEKETGFLATIDSTLPYLWLPDDICDKFAESFRLEYDEENNVYTFNSSARSYNNQQNATVVFKIGQDENLNNEATTISLPWAAFDLESSAPPFSNSTPYFPIRKSPNGIFVLGRAFLQEAYIVVDFERENFTVAPAIYSNPMPSADVMTIFSKDFKPPKPNETSTSQAGSGGGELGGGAIAGIVLGIVVVLGLLGAGAFFFWKRRKDKEQRVYEKDPQEIDTVQAGDQVKHRRVSELDSDPAHSPKSSIGGYYGRDGKMSPFPPITELDSPPAELYSPDPDSFGGHSDTPHSEKQDYFAGRVRRRGATRDSSTGGNTPLTPGMITPVAELPGDHGRFPAEVYDEPVVSPIQHSATPSAVHSRVPSDTNNIDEMLLGAGRTESPKPKSETTEKSEPSDGDVSEPVQQVERRPSHARGLSDTTVKSDETAVSQPTPEELRNWTVTPDDQPRRPLSE